MMYKKKIFLGYLMGLVKGEDTSCKHDDILATNDDYGVLYTEVLPVLYTNKEFLKTVYPQYIFKHNTVEEIENKIHAKFPITIKKFKKLNEDIAHSLRWSKYGVENKFYHYVRVEYKELIKRSIKFYVPIPILNHELKKVDLKKVNLPEDLVKYIHQGKAKIIIYQDSEGFLYKDSDIEWFNKFAAKHNLDKNNLFVESANQNFNNICLDYEKRFTPEKNKFSILPSTDFEDRPWFSRQPKNYPYELKFHYNNFFDYLDHKINYQHTKKLSALARRYSGERAAIFHKVQTTPVLKENTHSSLHNPYGSSKEECYRLVQYLRLSNEEEVISWLDNNFDFVNGHSCDLTEQHINWASELNPVMHRDTLVNVTIETHQTPSEEIFLSEKTYRPFYTAQPFIIFGNPGTLRVLKEMGYKTFDKFWDESYDENLPISQRLEKLYKTMIQIAETPMEVLNSYMEDFEPILRHNFNVMISSDRIIYKQKKLYNNLYTPEDIYIKRRKDLI